VNRPRTVIDNIQETVIDQVPVTSQKLVARQVNERIPVTSYEKQTILKKNLGAYGRGYGYGGYLSKRGGYSGYKKSGYKY